MDAKDLHRLQDLMAGGPGERSAAPGLGTTSAHSHVETLRALRLRAEVLWAGIRLSGTGPGDDGEANELAALDAAILALGQEGQRARIADGPMCAYGCPTPSFMEAAHEHGWVGDYPTGGGPYAAFDLAVQAGWREHVAVCPNHPQRKLEARVAELEAALYKVWGEDDCTDPCCVCKSEEAACLPGCIIATLPQVRG